MSIGEKIRFCRKLKGITQGKLAELSEIHPVSIRKYETNKMEPQLAQIEKISKALAVNSYAITGTAENIKLETIGDLIGIFIIMKKTGIIEIDGQRNKFDLLKQDTVAFKINPLVAKFFCLPQDKSLQELLFNIKNKNLLDDILRWERLYYLYKKAKNNYEKNPNDTAKQELDSLLEGLETAEIALQQSDILLTSDEPYTSHIFIENIFTE